VTRKARGSESQNVVAAWFARRGFPYALAAGAGRPGRDITGMLALAPEVKARAKFDPLAWVRQARANAGPDLPFVVFRCNGQGPTTVADWPVLLRLEDFTALLRQAGYGDPLAEEQTA
jgi:hypothetical protein